MSPQHALNPETYKTQTHRLDVELEDLPVPLDAQLEAVIGRQVEVELLGAGATEATSLRGASRRATCAHRTHSRRQSQCREVCGEQCTIEIADLTYLTEAYSRLALAHSCPAAAAPHLHNEVASPNGTTAVLRCCQAAAAVATLQTA